MSDLLDKCIEFTFNGKVHKVAERDIFIERQFSLWMMAEAALALDRLQSLVPNRFYQSQMDIYNSKLAGKMFDWGRVDCYNASVSSEGERHLLYLKLKRGESLGGAIIQRQEVDIIAQNKAKWNELLDILYKQDYPESYASFLSQRPESSQTQSVTTESQSQNGTPTNTGEAHNQPESQSPVTKISV